GLRTSATMSTRFGKFSNYVSVQLARSISALVMVWFVVFIVLHVSMVLVIGAVENLNIIFAARHSEGALGVVIFGVALAIIIAAWLWASPFTIRHPRVVQAVGEIGRASGRESEELP